MYIEKLAYKNVGPLQDVRIDFPFNNNGTPKPVILVGENGTGKSTILSNIVDSFYEMAQKHFMNATTPRENGGHNFFKTILPNEIHSGKSYMYSVLLYNCVETPNEESPIYICKSGNVTIDNIKEQTSTSISSISGSKEGNEKVVKASSEQVSSIWDKNVICYFGPDRYECPVWLGDSYYTYSDYLHPKVEGSFNGYLKNPEVIIEEGDYCVRKNKNNILVGDDDIKIYRDGKFIKSIHIESRPSTFDIGGENKDVLFITARDGIYVAKIDLEENDE